MLLRLFSILTVCFFSSAISNAATIKPENIFSFSSINKNIFFVQSKEISNNFNIIDGRLFLSKPLQTELANEIIQTQKCLNKLNNFLNKKLEPKIGLVYIHKGYSNWSLRFTYGGYLLKTKTEIIVSTSKISNLKKTFANTEYLQIASNNYQTTRYMNQLGPILHELK